MKMTIEKAIKILEEEKKYSCLFESYGDGDTEWAKAYNMAIYALKHKLKTGQWIPVSESGYPKPEDEYKRFITIDNKGEITIQEFLLSLDEEPQPYFTGWRNIVAYMPLPEVYKEK